MNLLNLISILKYGFFIKTQTSFLNSWITNIILKTDGDTITIPYIDAYQYGAILPNDYIKCRFNVNEHEITLFCVVECITFSSPPSLKLKVLKVNTWNNLRDSERYDVNYLSEAEMCDTKDCFVVLVTNLSVSGAALVSKQQIKLESKISLMLFVMDNFFTKTYATVVRNRNTLDNKIEYGLKFLNIAEEEKQRIETTINLVKNKEADIHKKLCSKYKMLTD